MSAVKLQASASCRSRLKRVLNGPFGILIFGWGFGLLLIGLVVLFIGLSLDGLVTWSFDEVSRVPHPNANIDAVLVETNGGATTSFGYEVFLFPRGQKPQRSDQAVVSLYGAGRNPNSYGAKLRWAANDTLVVEYLDAQHAYWRNGTLAVDGRLINIVLNAGVNDPTAPPGGMLYNLERHH